MWCAWFATNSLILADFFAVSLYIMNYWFAAGAPSLVLEDKQVADEKWRGGDPVR